MRGVIFGVVSLVGAAFFVTAAIGWPSAFAATVLDDFSDNTLHEAKWESNTYGGGGVAEVNQRVEFTHAAALSADDFGGQYFGRCSIRGDFDVQVDFQLVTWPTGNGVRTALSVGPFALERTSFGKNGDFGAAPRENYIAQINGLTVLPTDDMSGKLRLERTGATVTASYADGDNWVQVDSKQGQSTEDVEINLLSWANQQFFNDALVVAAMDNVVINEGDFTCWSFNGDLDCDGDIDPRDALVAIVHDAGSDQITRGFDCPPVGVDVTLPASEPTGPTLFGDANCDQTVNAGDGGTILQYVADVTLAPAQEPDCVAVGQNYPEWNR